MTIALRRSLGVLVLVTLAVTIALTAPDAQGKGGGGGGPQIPPADSGQIYYEVNLNTPLPRETWAMATDGTGKTLLSGILTPATSSWPVSVPTTALHGTPPQRWFVQFRAIPGSTYGNGRPRTELFAVNELGTLVRQLTSSEVEKEVSDGLAWAAEGGVADGKVSYAGHVVNADGSPGAAGLWVLEVDWTALLAGTWSPAAPALVPGIGGANLRYCWSPDGSQVAYAQIAGDGKLYRIAADGTGGALVWGNGVANTPAWSTGDEIAFLDGLGGQNRDLWRIRPDGSGLFRVLADPGESKVLGSPRWSPSGTHLVYTQQDMGRGKTGSVPATEWVLDVRRIARDGTGDVNLTGDVPAQAQTVGWRP